MDDTFDDWNIHTLVVWNKAGLETCVIFKAVPNQIWTYFDNAINLNIHSAGSSDVDAQPRLTAEAREQLLLLDIKTDKIVEFLEETTRKDGMIHISKSCCSSMMILLMSWPSLLRRIGRMHPIT
jgi:hypothetical protein